MRFIVAMAWREVRASWRRLVLFFLCIALGVGAMVSLRSFSRVFEGSLARDARILLSADVRVENNDRWTAAQIDIFARRGASPTVLGQTRTLETQTVVRADGVLDARPVMVNLRGVEASFPLRGEVRLLDGARYDHRLLEGRGVVVSPSLLDRLHVKVGDRIIIAGTPFTIRAGVARFPGNALDFSPLPRVAADYGDVEAAGLTAFGSRVRYYWLFNVRDGDERDFASSIGRDYRERHVNGSIGTFHWVESWLSDGLSNIDGFLSLIGLAIVVLAGIGIASVMRVFVEQRIATVAILKCLGGRSRRVIGAYVAQVLALSVGGSLLGLLVAQGITSASARFASSRLPLDMDPRLSPLACLQGVLVGVLVALLFALPPLLDIRDVKPILVLRHDVGGRRRAFDWLKAAAQLLLAAAIVALAGWQAGTYRNAALFIGGIVATTVILHATSTLLMLAVARLRRLPSFVLRQGVGSLYRPGNQTRVTLFTVGLGALFVIAVRLFQVNLQQEYTLDLTGLSVDMFLIDVLPPQRAAVGAALDALGATDVTLLPVSRGRLVGLKRDPANRDRVPANQIGGEYRLTDRTVLDSSETIVSGRFWPATPLVQAGGPVAAVAEVSVEIGFAQWMRLRLGDALVFEIAGRRIDARVTSIRQEDRKVRTLSSLVRSDVVFRPGVLEGFPHMYVGGAKGPADGGARATLQNDFLARYPGVTLVDALDEIEEVRRRVADISRAVSVLGGFVLICGVLILVGSVAMTKMHRLYEAAILKTLGARRGVLVRITVIEYAVLGVLAGLIGSCASIAVTWGMSRYGRPPLVWHVHPLINLAGVVVTMVLVVVVGVLASWDVLVRKPLSLLRES